jgi:hypothetical protein
VNERHAAAQFRGANPSIALTKSTQERSRTTAWTNQQWHRQMIGGIDHSRKITGATGLELAPGIARARHSNSPSILEISAATSLPTAQPV